MPLKILSLARCRLFTDAGLALLRGAPLVDLDLSNCNNITDNGLQALIEGKALTALDLHGCARITEGIIPTLKGLPLVNLSVSRDGFSEVSLEGLIEAVQSIVTVEVYTNQDCKILHGHKGPSG